MLRIAFGFGGALALTGCQTFSTDGGMTPVAAFTQSELGKTIGKLSSEEDAHAARAIVMRLLKRPLTADIPRFRLRC